MTVTGAVITRTNNKRSKRFSNTRAPRVKKGSKNDEFILEQAQQLVSELVQRGLNRPLYDTDKAVESRVLDIAARQIRNANRFKRKSRQMARTIVDFVISNNFVDVAAPDESSGRFTHEVTETGLAFVGTRSRQNHPSARLSDDRAVISS